MNNYTELRL